MEENRKGFILPYEEAPIVNGPKEGNSNVEFHAFLRRATDPPGGGKEHSMHTRLDLYVIQPGGSVEEHYHEPPIIDHISFVISGRVRVTVGDTEKIVGADTLIYCPSNVRHSVTNIGDGLAKIMTIDASNKGERSGILVYSKMPTGGALEGKTWKVGGK